MTRSGSRRGQRGWAGLVLLLLALLVIAIVGQKMLREYGLTTSSQTGSATAQKGASGATDAVPGGAVDATAATPVTRNAIERARGVEATVQQQADDAAKRIDEQSR